MVLSRRVAFAVILGAASNAFPVASFAAPPGSQSAIIQVLAIVTAKAGLRDEVLVHFRANEAAVRAEKGCIEYGATIDTEGLGAFQAKFGPDTFVVIEKWESIEALRAHFRAPHMAAYVAKTRDLIASTVIHVLSPT